MSAATAKQPISSQGSAIGAGAFSVSFPLKTVSGLNVREHWAVRAKRVKAERWATGMACAALPKTLPSTIRLTRLSKGTLDDDNLRGAFKGVRDAIAEKLGVDDADPRIVWEYAQEKAKDFGVRVEAR